MLVGEIKVEIVLLTFIYVCDQFNKVSITSHLRDTIALKLVLTDSSHVNGVTSDGVCMRAGTGVRTPLGVNLILLSYM